MPAGGNGNWSALRPAQNSQAAESSQLVSESNVGKELTEQREASEASPGSDPGLGSDPGHGSEPGTSSEPGQGSEAATAGSRAAGLKLTPVTAVIETPAGAAFGPILGLLIFIFTVSQFVLFLTAWAATARI